jgi:hypothetical protein
LDVALHGLAGTFGGALSYGGIHGLVLLDGEPAIGHPIVTEQPKPVQVGS